MKKRINSEFLNKVRAAYDALRADMNRAWQRDLPFEELLFDRWERAAKLGFGKGSSIYHNSYVYGDVRVGKNTWIGPYTLLDGSGGLRIGNFCSISSGVQIYSHNTVCWAVSGGKAAYERNPVKIGNACFIGAQSVIRDGITIGNHAVVGSCSFVNKDVPAYGIVFGNPAVLVGKVKIGKRGKVTFRYFKS